MRLLRNFVLSLILAMTLTASLSAAALAAEVPKSTWQIEGQTSYFTLGESSGAATLYNADGSLSAPGTYSLNGQKVVITFNMPNENNPNGKLRFQGIFVDKNTIKINRVSASINNKWIEMNNVPPSIFKRTEHPKIRTF